MSAGTPTPPGPGEAPIEAPAPGADAPGGGAGHEAAPAERHAVGSGRVRTAGVAALTLGALGVVFGDIGTSPLYALHTVFSVDDRAVRPDEAAVYGVVSL